MITVRERRCMKTEEIRRLLVACRLAYSEPGRHHPALQKARDFYRFRLRGDMGFCYYVNWGDRQDIIFRGTDTKGSRLVAKVKKWLRNVDMWPVRDNGFHDGMYRTWSSFEGSIFALIHSGIVKRDLPLNIAGHSLGGGLAQIASMRIFEDYAIPHAVLSVSDPAIMTSSRKGQALSYRTRSFIDYTRVYIERDFVTRACPLSHPVSNVIKLPVLRAWHHLPLVGTDDRHIIENVIQSFDKAYL